MTKIKLSFRNVFLLNCALFFIFPLACFIIGLPLSDLTWLTVCIAFLILFIPASSAFTCLILSAEITKDGIGSPIPMKPLLKWENINRVTNSGFYYLLSKGLAGPFAVLPKPFLLSNTEDVGTALKANAPPDCKIQSILYKYEV